MISCSAQKSRNLRNVNPKKQMPIYVFAPAQDKENGDRFTPATKITTGMEKDEEKEGHLQAAMKSQKSKLRGNSIKAESVSIPIPVFETLVESSTAETYHEFKRKRTNSHLEPNSSDTLTPVEEVKETSYDLDEEDAKWLLKLRQRQLLISDNEFESAIEVLENSSRNRVMSFAAFCYKLPGMDTNKLNYIYDYWLDKRTEICRKLPSASLIPIIPSCYDLNENDPYVAFRKRETEHKRRSMRIALHTLTANSGSKMKSNKTEEEIGIERAEHLEQLQYQIDFNSEIDGPFSFHRNRFCTYKKPGELDI